MKDIFLIDNIKNYNDDFYKKNISIIKRKKRKMINSYSNLEDRKRSILGELLLIKAIKKIKIDYSSIEIKYNTNGKPYIKNNIFYYNISHKKDYVCVIISSKKIGIDIEYIDKYNDNLLNYITDINEKKLIKNNIDFYKLYTLKEAYIKMRGKQLKNINDIKFKSIKRNIKSNKNINAKSFIFDNNYIVSIIKEK